jgi:uncharacterized delta-60 repeat protein
MVAAMLGLQRQPRRARSLAVLIGMAVVLFGAGVAQAGAGDLDPTFDGDGRVTSDVTSADRIRAIVVQPDGRILIGGFFTTIGGGGLGSTSRRNIARLDSFGNVDSFDPGTNNTVVALALQSDGKFVLVGSLTVGTFPASSTHFALMRLKADGSTDTSFGTGGTVTTAFAVNAAAAGVALQRDGKIVAVGTTVLAVNPNFVVARYNADGSIDTGFGSNGNLSIDFFGFNDIGESVLVQPDGKIVVSGQAQNIFDGYGLARINP